MNQVDWSNFLEIQYWVEGIAGSTSVTPVVEVGSIFFNFFVTLFTVLFGLGLVLLTATKFTKEKNPLDNKLIVWGNNYLWMGLLGLLWFLLRQIEIGFLGSRIWLLVGLVWFIVLCVLQIRYFLIYFPLEWKYFKKNSA